MTEQAAIELADTLNAKAPSGVRYEVRETDRPHPHVTPFYVRRVTQRGTLRPVEEASGQRALVV